MAAPHILVAEFRASPARRRALRARWLRAAAVAGGAVFLLALIGIFHGAP